MRLCQGPLCATRSAQGGGPMFRWAGLLRPCRGLCRPTDAAGPVICMSTATYLKDRILPGTVIVSDEDFNYDGWRRSGEYRAFQECLIERGLAMTTSPLTSVISRRL